MPLDDEVVVAAFSALSLIASTVSAFIVSGKSGPGSHDNGFHLHSRVRRGRKGYDDDEKHVSDGWQHPGRDRCMTTPKKTESMAPEIKTGTC